LSRPDEMFLVDSDHETKQDFTRIQVQEREKSFKDNFKALAIFKTQARYIALLIMILLLKKE
jgi:hypothetical protein